MPLGTYRRSTAPAACAYVPGPEEAEALIMGASSWWPPPLQVIVRDFPTRWRLARAPHAGYINRLLFTCVLCYINHDHLVTEAYLYYRLQKNRFVIK